MLSLLRAMLLAFAPVGCAFAGETLYNGIELPEKWPPRIDAMFPGPNTPHYLKNPPKATTLFAFLVSKDSTGKSGGYVAAGGPDYPGPRDE